MTAESTLSIMMKDLIIAREILETQELSLVVVKSGATIFTSKASGVLGLVNAIISCGSTMRGASVADRVIGRAAALLCVYSGVLEVYAALASEPGRHVLEKHKIPIEYHDIVPNILDRNRVGMCPFEKLTEKIESPEEAFLSIVECLKSVK